MLTKAVRHGNRDDATKLVHLRDDVTRDWVRLEVQDDGAGFDPSAVPDLRVSARRVTSSFALVKEQTASAH